MALTASAQRLSSPAKAALSRLDRDGEALAFAAFGEVPIERTFLHFSDAAPARPRAASAPPGGDLGAEERALRRLCGLTNKHEPMEAPREAAKHGGKERERSGSRSSRDYSASVATAAEGDSVSEGLSSSGYPTSSRSLEDFSRASSLLPVSGGPALHLYSEALAWCRADPASAQAEYAQHEYASLAMSVPYDEFGNATSLGSLAHFDGTCKPCVFASHATKVCQNGLLCPFCHLAHAPKRRHKPRATKAKKWPQRG